MSDGVLLRCMEAIDVFAEIEPNQKERIRVNPLNQSGWPQQVNPGADLRFNQEFVESEETTRIIFLIIKMKTNPLEKIPTRR